LDLGLLAKCCKDGAGITSRWRDEVAEIPERLFSWVYVTAVGQLVLWPPCPSSNAEKDKAIPLAVHELLDTASPPTVEERVVRARVYHGGVFLT
jgi:hypothetical protein